MKYCRFSYRFQKNTAFSVCYSNHQDYLLLVKGPKQVATSRYSSWSFKLISYTSPRWVRVVERRSRENLYWPQFSQLWESLLHGACSTQDVWCFHFHLRCTQPILVYFSMYMWKLVCLPNLSIFSNHDTSKWFSLLGCNFCSHQITNLTKIIYITTLLPTIALLQLSDLISITSNSETPHENHKLTLVNFTTNC